MIYINNCEQNVKLGFDFLENLPEDFDIAKSEYEKWIPFILNISSPEKNIAITQNMQACMTVYEIKKMFNDLKALISGTRSDKDVKISHYSSESFFEFTLEYFRVDDCFSLEFWFITAEYPDGKIIGYDVGIRFIIEKSEMIHFMKEFQDRFRMICPQIDL